MVGTSETMVGPSSRSSASRTRSVVEALVDDRRRGVDGRAHHDRQAADVRQRQRAQPALGRVEAQRDGRAERAPQPVAVGELDRLRRPARARGVHHDGRGVEVVALAQARLRGRGADDGAVDDLDRALRDPLALARAQAQVDRDGDRAQAQDRVQGDAEGLARRQRDADAVAGAHAAAGQAPRGRVDLAEQLGVGHRVHGRAVGMALGRPRQPGIDEHGWHGSGKSRCRPVAGLSGFLR